jgi:hypothetical protein
MWGAEAPPKRGMGAHARGVDREKKVVKIFSDGNFGGWSAS